MEQIQLPVDKNTAPVGFYAVAKPTVSDRVPNPCKLCDFRSKCCDPATDLTLSNHRCMSYARSDQRSVMFKLIK